MRPRPGTHLVQPHDDKPPDDNDSHTRRARHNDDDTVDNSFLPRTKLEFLTYDGKGYLLPWLNRYETFFRGQKNSRNP